MMKAPAWWRIGVLLALVVCLPQAVFARTVAVGTSHMVVAKPDGTVWTWGANGSGQLGTGDTTPRAVPTPVTGLVDIIAVAAGANHTLALDGSGTVWAWGYGAPVGTGTAGLQSTPVALALTNIVSIAAGSSHSVALQSDGTVWVWGANSNGQLGNGTLSAVFLPVALSTISGVAAIETGSVHTLAVKSDGTAWGWGVNTYGQLGDGTTTQRTAPVQVSGITGATAVDGGLWHSLILLADGTVKAVGANNSGQLGDGTTTERRSPVLVSGLAGVTSVTADEFTSGARRADGTVVLWGSNGSGQLGDGTSTFRRTPAAPLVLPSGMTLLANGAAQTLAVSSDGIVFTWGANAFGQLGDGTPTPRSVPDAISGPNYDWHVGTPVFSKSPGSYTASFSVTVTEATPGADIHYTLTGDEPTESDPAIVSGGTILIDRVRTLKARAWKLGMPASRIAAATYTLTATTPVLTPGPANYSSPQTVTMSTSTVGGTIRYTTDGNEPTSSSTAYSTPVAIGTTTPVKASTFKTDWATSAVAAGTYRMQFGTLSAPTTSPAAGTYTSSVVVTLSSIPGATIYYTTNGSTPNTSSPAYLAPVTLATTTTIKMLATHPDYTTSGVSSSTFTIEVAAPTLTPTAGTYPAGQTVSVSTTTPGATITYTTNGAEPTVNDPTVPPGGSLVLANYVLKARAWKTGCAPSPVTTATYAMSGALATYALAGGGSHSLAVRADGTVWSWGYGWYGTLGDGTSASRGLPVMVNGLSGVTRVAAGRVHSLALTTAQQLAVWGANTSGQLGLSDGPQSRYRPVSLPGVTNIVQTVAGGAHTLALEADGTVVSWGANTYGQLGDGTTTSKATATIVTGLTNVTAVAAGEDYSLALKADGTVWSWGRNNFGQLGDGTTTLHRTTPVQVSGLTGVARIAAGYGHALALAHDGTVQAWGANGAGQLGDGGYVSRALASAVPGLSSITAVAAGSSYSLALTASGDLLAFGGNGFGQLGNGSPLNLFPSPTPATGLPALVAIAAGDAHAFGLTADASVWAWGRNDFGQIGDGTTTDRRSPVQIAGPGMAWQVPTPTLSVPSGTYGAEQNVVVLCDDPTASLHYTLNGNEPTEGDPLVASGGSIAVTQSLTLKVRGWRTGSPASVVTLATYELKVLAPVLAPGSSSSASPVSVSMASATSGATFTYTMDGTEPTATSTSYTGAVAVAYSTTVRARAFKTGWTPSDSGLASYWIAQPLAIAPTISPEAGTYQAPVLVSIATAEADATLRYTTDGTEPSARSPVYDAPVLLRLSTTMKARAFKNGGGQSAVTTVAYVLDDPSAVPTPSIVPAGGRFATRQTVTMTGPVGATLRYTLDGSDPTEAAPSLASGSTLTVDRSSVVKVRAWQAASAASAVRRADFVITGALSANQWHVMALKSDRTVWTWGENAIWGLGDSVTLRTAPGQVMSDAVAISAGKTHFMAVKSDGTVWNWGTGRVGDGTTTFSRTPKMATGLANVVAVAAGATHSLALKMDGTIWAWGDNAAGQLGDGTQTERLSATQVSGLTGVTAIAAGDRFSLALATSGTRGGRVWAWGVNASGQLGDGTAASRPVPTLVPLPVEAVAIAAGPDWACASGIDGRLWCWGANGTGQHGNGTNVASRVPVEVRPTMGGGELSAGNGHALRIGADGRLWSWGDNDSGDLSAPVSVAIWNPIRSIATSEPVLVAAGWFSSHVAWADGTVSGIGRNGSGQLGNGTQTASGTWVSTTGLRLADNTWLTSDPDGDGLSTWREYALGLDPLSADSNGNGIPDDVEAAAGTSGRHPDDDGDGVPNEIERLRGTDPFRADTDGDGVSDGLDAFPLDPTRSQAPTPTPGDVTPPIITLIEPTTARPVP